MHTVLSTSTRRPGASRSHHVAAELAANDLWDMLHCRRTRRRPPVRRPSRRLTNPLARRVRELPPLQFQAWRRFLHEAGIHPTDFTDDIAGADNFPHVPFGRLLRYRDWLLAHGYPDLLAPLLTPPALVPALALAA